GVRIPDDELTSLSWLQDSNLLRGTALSPVKVKMSGGGAVGGNGVAVAAESPTSDYGDESNDGLLLEPGEVNLNDQPHTQPSRSQPIPYNPQVHVNAKPPYSFSCLIFMAIEDSVNKALPVKDIYAWILEHFPYFRNAPTGWKNSVRHNLSLNKCFRKVEKAPNLGKGSLWMVDGAYRPNLLQALSKTPFHPYSNLDRIYMVSTKNTHHKRPVGQTSTPEDTSTTVAPPRPPTSANIPDPELFPYLARCLGSTPGSALGTALGSPGVQSEDVDAAAAMLALKHGPRIVTPASESYLQLRDGKDTSVLYEENRKRRRKRKHSEVSDDCMMVISSSPSEDHSYTTVDDNDDCTTQSTRGAAAAAALLLPPKRTAIHLPTSTHSPTPSTHSPTSSTHSPTSSTHSPTSSAHSPTSSIDEAFSDDSYDSDVVSEAGMRQLVAGADALLNLAAVATSLASRRTIDGGCVLSGGPRGSLTPCHQLQSSMPHRGKVHISKQSSARSSHKSSVGGKKKKKKEEEVALVHNNNTIIDDNNSVLKDRRPYGGPGRCGGARRQQQQLPSLQ
ncbi:hypothetical protein OTU49_008575, partial [Cherax quadricarinatus]